MRTAPAGIFLCIAVAANEVAVYRAAAFERGGFSESLARIEFQEMGE